MLCEYIGSTPKSHGALPACLQDLKFSVHTHPTLSEVLDELIKTSHVEAPAQKRPEPKVLDPKLKELQPLPA